VSLLPITLAAENYDRTRGLIDGSIRPEGIDLNFIPLAVEETFWRMTRYLEFDASEMSGTAYLIERTRPNPRFIAIPVFLSRTFRHSAIYVRADSGIEQPKDLAGRRVGVPEYGLTALTWVRAFLQHDYGVRPGAIKWMVGGEEQAGREERAPFQPPPDVSIEPIPLDETLSSMIVAGTVDAIIAPRMPSPFAEGSPLVRRLFPDYRTVEEDYYRRTGLVPIMHFAVIREAVHQRHPWVAESLYKAFCAAKDQAMRYLFEPNVLVCSLPWLVPEVERERAIFGPDLWPYGLTANRKTLEAMVAYHVEQGIIPKAIPVEELFAESTLVEYRI
jgi:4,5-dihydroxyphthalate decarboxylase